MGAAIGNIGYGIGKLKRFRLWSGGRAKCRSRPGCSNSGRDGRREPLYISDFIVDLGGKSCPESSTPCVDLYLDPVPEEERVTQPGRVLPGASHSLRKRNRRHGADHRFLHTEARSQARAQERGALPGETVVVGPNRDDPQLPHERDPLGGGQIGRWILGSDPVELSGKPLPKSPGDDERMEALLASRGRPKKRAAPGRVRPFVEVAHVPVRT